MTSAQVVETSVNVISNSPSQDYTHPDDRTLLNYAITYYCSFVKIYILVLQKCKIPLLNRLQQYNLKTIVIHPLMYMYFLKLFGLYLALSMSIIVLVIIRHVSLNVILLTLNEHIHRPHLTVVMFDSLSSSLWCRSIRA